MHTAREFALPSSYRTPFQRVAPGVFTLPGQFTGRVYVLEAADGLTLVDTGLAWRSRSLRESIQGAGRSLRDVHRVLLTHVHPAHMGGLRYLQANADLEVITLAANGSSLKGQIRCLADGDTIAELFGGLTVIGTPGHLSGHASFWLPKRGVLFTGDTLASCAGLRLLPSWMHHDMAGLKRDVARLARLNPAAICCGHGPPITRDAARCLRAVRDALHRR